ncbi:hypothetical protein COT47_00415 [Candidatus Woesearchaeota archaeon CG08_land_8_20_14_0_20_43_7]|nr:MAG: hypothetical protein COT47_00415 [Candidatus Woesearchaeota archaeon CG08_land_8_20_14_0_20_43_7]
MVFLEALFGFLVSLIVSSVIIYFAARLLGETEGFGTAIMAALSGAIIFPLMSYLFGVGWIAALLAGIAWLIALGSIYSIGWVRAFIIAVVIWLLTTVVSLVLPTIGRAAKI